MNRIASYWVLCLALLFTDSTLAQNADFDWVGDSYPKNTGIDVLHYSFDIALTDNSDLIQVSATTKARYLNGGQNELRLDLIEQSDALEGKGMAVEGVFMEGESLTYRHEEDQLFISLGRDMAEDEIVEVEVRYAGVPATGLIIGPTKYGDFSFFSDNWSSKAHNWLATVDHPYDKATSEFIVTAPIRLQVVSNGLLMEETDLGNGLRRTHWKNSVPIPTWLYALAAAEFAVQYVDTFDGKSIQTWVYRQDRDKGFYDFAIPTKQALAWLTDLVGPYSYEKLANIQSNSVGGGMEAASAVFYGDRSVTGNRDKRWQHVIVHEIAHQWFGNAVTEYHWNHLWLSEGFATYYTLLFREYAYGKEDFIDGLKDARNRIVVYYRENYDFQIIRDDLPDLNNVSNGMIYQKGAWVLHMLRHKIGVDAYNQGISTYYAEYQDKTALTGDLRRHLEEASGINLREFFGQWLYQGGIPSLEGTWWNEDGRLKIELKQVQESYLFNLDVEFDVYFDDGSKERVTLNSNSRDTATHSTQFEKEITRVVLDPDTNLLASWNFNPR